MGALFYYAPEKTEYFFYKKAIRRINPLQKQKISAQPCPFDVKTQTMSRRLTAHECQLIDV